MGEVLTKKELKQRKLAYVQIAESKKFKELMKKKNSFIFPLTAFFLIFYFALPVLTSYTDILEQTAIGDISWAWVFAFSQFAMTWTLVILYMRKATAFDRLTDEIIEEEAERASVRR